MEPDSPATLTCLNCDREFTPPSARRVLFCGDVCRETAQAVRYIRRAYGGLDAGEWVSEDVEMAIKIKVAFAIHGGYPRERRLTEETRAFVLDRDGHTCQTCGQPGNEIHHLTSDSAVLNDPGNLQTICHQCHLRISYGSLVEAKDPDVKEAIRAIYHRAISPEPQRTCDDESNWADDHKKIAAERRKQLTDARYSDVRARMRKLLEC